MPGLPWLVGIESVGRSRSSTRDSSCGNMFELRVESVFSIAGRGSVLVGRVEKGPIRVGDPVVLQTPTREVRATITGLERDRKLLSRAEPGEKVGVLCRAIRPEHVADSLVGEGDERRPEQVFLVSAPKRWWELWRE